MNIFFSPGVLLFMIPAGPPGWGRSAHFVHAGPDWMPATSQLRKAPIPVLVFPTAKASSGRRLCLFIFRTLVLSKHPKKCDRHWTEDSKAPQPSLEIFPPESSCSPLHSCSPFTFLKIQDLEDLESKPAEPWATGRPSPPVHCPFSSRRV